MNLDVRDFIHRLIPFNRSSLIFYPLQTAIPHFLCQFHITIEPPLV
jgi:hypothetical protein